MRFNPKRKDIVTEDPPEWVGPGQEFHPTADEAVLLMLEPLGRFQEDMRFESRPVQGIF
jgi:hypothetical protein